MLIASSLSVPRAYTKTRAHGGCFISSVLWRRAFFPLKHRDSFLHYKAQFSKPFLLIQFLYFYIINVLSAYHHTISALLQLLNSNRAVGYWSENDRCSFSSETGGWLSAMLLVLVSPRLVQWYAVRPSSFSDLWSLVGRHNLCLV